MDTCVYCGTKTQLYENAIPVCVDCAKRKDAGEKLTRRTDNRRPLSDQHTPAGASSY